MSQQHWNTQLIQMIWLHTGCNKKTKAAKGGGALQFESNYINEREQVYQDRNHEKKNL